MNESERWETEGSGSVERISRWEEVHLSFIRSVSSDYSSCYTCSDCLGSQGVDHESSFEAEVLSRYPQVEVFGYDFSVLDASL